MEGKGGGMFVLLFVGGSGTEGGENKKKAEESENVFGRNGTRSSLQFVNRSKCGKQGGAGKWKGRNCSLRYTRTQKRIFLCFAGESRGNVA
jgi:hypothetical protein